jgi:hypothetical protein
MGQLAGGASINPAHIVFAFPGDTESTRTQPAFLAIDVKSYYWTCFSPVQTGVNYRGWSGC